MLVAHADPERSTRIAVYFRRAKKKNKQKPTSATSLTDLRKFIVTGKWEHVIDAMKRDPAHVKEWNIPLLLQVCPDIPDDASKEILTVYWRFVSNDQTGEKST